MKDLSNEQRDLMALRELSARLASNPLLVQASSGNISIKIDDTLWIKASGKWLIQAEADDFFVAVGLARAKRCLRENTAIPETKTKSPGSAGASIETGMHAALPQRVVVHVHSVNTIAWAVREDGPQQLTARLAGLRWGWIPYTPSGIALAKKIDDVLLCFPHTDVLVLGNHGLVVCGDCCRSAEQLLADVEERLSTEPRSAREPDLAELAERLPGPGWFVPQWTGIHALATDSVSRHILSGGVLYPCQAIFLPGTVPSLVRAFSHVVPAARPRQTFRLLEDQGVLCSEHMTPAERQMLLGLANVVRRIDASAPLRYLSASEVKDVLQGETEGYRRVANANFQSGAMIAH